MDMGQELEQARQSPQVVVVELVLAELSHMEFLQELMEQELELGKAVVSTGAGGGSGACVGRVVSHGVFTGTDGAGAGTGKAVVSTGGGSGAVLQVSPWGLYRDCGTDGAGAGIGKAVVSTGAGGGSGACVGRVFSHGVFTGTDGYGAGTGKAVVSTGAGGSGACVGRAVSTGN
ncbi:hypothetical protein BASA62_004005 [Batrachochytrium salamandrivorans]|nr:hypothetical protein BASA62_004005 [Batrachochytrium salamandrivorans]